MAIRTKTKIAAVRVAARVIRLARRLMGLGNEVVVSRGGVRWALDLHEAIDFTVYLLGMFERQTVRVYQRLVRPGDLVLDVGANMGAHALHLARMVGAQGRVIAFEPTDFAFQKLARNISLNPDLAPRLQAEQIMLAAEAGASVPDRLYSSWPLARSSDLHGQHCGRLMETRGACAISLDEYLARAKIDNVALLKMDVDGHECSVLLGGSDTLKHKKPIIIMELASYLFPEYGHSVEELLGILSSTGYGMFSLATGRPLPSDPDAIRALTAEGSSLNVLAKPI